MRTNTDILVNYEPENINHEKTLFTWETCESAMIEAQVEALKELMKRDIYWIMGNDDKSKSIYKAINDTFSKLIKELES